MLPQINTNSISDIFASKKVGLTNGTQFTIQKLREIKCFQIK
jgi:hypothetical protein